MTTEKEKNQPKLPISQDTLASLTHAFSLAPDHRLLVEKIAPIIRVDKSVGEPVIIDRRTFVSLKDENQLLVYLLSLWIGAYMGVLTCGKISIEQLAKGTGLNYAVTAARLAELKKKKLVTSVRESGKVKYILTDYGAYSLQNISFERRSGDSDE